MIRSGEMMLRYLGEDAAAEAIRGGLHDLYSDPSCLTADLGGSQSTADFGAALADRVRARLDA